ncbi:MAG TPA: Rid family detoxifying hydrolase [Clostridia bacterium]
MKKTIFTEFAPRPGGPYAQAVLAGGLLYGAGQLGLDPLSGQMVSGGAVEQAGQVLANIGAVLSAGGLTPADVVKVTIYMTDLADFAAVNAVYAGFFPASPPARTTVQVAALPLGGKVEMDFIAAVPSL